MGTVFPLLTHHVMMWRWHRNVSFSFSFFSSFSSTFSSFSFFSSFSSLEKWLVVSLLFLSKASSSPLSGSKGACDLSEMNILDHDRFVDSPGECQAMCRDMPLCNWFTHFSTQCYLLAECGDSAHCSGCVSGPTSPGFGTCPWPPGVIAT